MKSAYNEDSLYKLEVIKETKRWLKGTLISKEQFGAISEANKVAFYHPNLMIRLLLFVAAAIALSGASGLLGLMFAEAGVVFLSIGAIVYGIISFVVLEKAFLKNDHFKSGVTEAVMYHACGFIIGGVSGLSDFNSVGTIVWTCIIVFSFAGIRYLDFLTTIAAIGSFAYALFYHLHNLGGIMQQLIPFAFILVFTTAFLYARMLKQKKELRVWTNNLIVAESLFLLLIYCGGNYFVVRELSVNLLNLQIEPGGDIPFAILFYLLTSLIPCLYLYFGIKKKDIVLIRVSLFVLAFSAFTFKYYYSLGPPEITLTIAGIIVFAFAMALMNYLKEMINGFTRENLLSEKWASTNVQAFIISQTLGGNQASSSIKDAPGDGEFGGGGSTESF
ncbi:MAG: hypothetical protein HYR67_09130 [Bacteroidetes bacterium]|nr:hypothetical protein [Bacteroidota bacterium]